MAKDLNTSNLGSISMDGDLLFVDFVGADRTEVRPAALDGSVIEGVFVANGAMAAVGEVGREVRLPKSKKARDAFLKKWSEKAAANKGLAATLLILPLAACGGGDDPVFEVTVSTVGRDEVVAFLNETAMIVVDIANGVATFTSAAEVAATTVANLRDNVIEVADGQTIELSVDQLQDATVTAGVNSVQFEGAGDVRIVLTEAAAGSSTETEVITVKVALTGGNLTFDLPNDDNDIITLSSESNISLGGGNLIVDDGVVDARQATITGANTIGNIQVASELILTKAQYDLVSGSVTTSGTGKLTVEVGSLADALDVMADDGDKIASDIDLTLKVADGADLGALSIAQFIELRSLVSNLDDAIANHGVHFDIVDTADNLMRVSGITTVFKSGVEAILNVADTVTVTDQVNSAERALLEGLTPAITYSVDPDVTAPTIAVAVDHGALLAGQTAEVTFTLSEASTNFVQGDVVVSGGASLASWQGPDETGIANVYKAILVPPTSYSGTVTIRVNSQAFTDLVGNYNLDGADSNNLASISVSTPE